LFQTGTIEASLLHLNQYFCLPYLPDLIARKISGSEKSMLDDTDLAFYKSEFERLTNSLEEAMARSTLPESPTTRQQLNDLLVRIRLGNCP
jgi:uncharacterized protein